MPASKHIVMGAPTRERVRAELHLRAERAAEDMCRMLCSIGVIWVTTDVASMIHELIDSACPGAEKGCVRVDVPLHPLNGYYSGKISMVHEYLVMLEPTRHNTQAVLLRSRDKSAQLYHALCSLVRPDNNPKADKEHQVQEALKLLNEIDDVEIVT